ncbi:sulfatase [Flavobacterium sp. UMI-01]|uniref:sulfatase n=1 Tax=Flavobacterium sp. UMI-01 TaxID=1441053 RepID=UPI001C7D3683|nr:sulfatase [Flavobacterium sp. UMI-01]GIZ09773.1 iduronate-2-sulfatase [Flavobacterium sp. UMI-01]
MRNKARNILLFLFSVTSVISQEKQTIGAKNNAPKNVLLICIDDLRPELHSFGATYIKSPNIDYLSSIGRPFIRHYVNAPSCGPSRYTMLTGRYGIEYRNDSNEALFSLANDRSKNPDQFAPTMPEWFRKQGYTTVSVGKISHHPGGYGGKYWDDENIIEMPNAWDKHLMPVGEWKNPSGAMHGLANGKIREANNKKVLETVEGPDTLYPDGLIAEEGLKQLGELATGDKPFFLAIGLIKPHLPFGVPKKYLDQYEGVAIPSPVHPEKPTGKTTWHPSNEFMNYDRDGKDPREDKEFALELKKYYAACVTYADKQVGDILKKLKETGADKNTIIVLWGDHGWHLGEHAIWGKHSLFEESLRSPLIIYNPDMKYPGKQSHAVVETLDVFPTLCDLTKLSKPDFAQGTSLAPILENPNTKGHATVAYTAEATTIRTNQYRFIEHCNGDVELYNHLKDPYEIKNIATKNPELVLELRKQMEAKLKNPIHCKN